MTDRFDRNGAFPEDTAFIGADRAPETCEDCTSGEVSPDECWCGGPLPEGWTLQSAEMKKEN